MDQLNTIVDRPALTEGEGDAPPTSRIQVAKLGTFKHPLYGTFTVTRDEFAQMQSNLGGLSGGEAPLDFDHTPQRGGPTAACGWIRALDQRGTDGASATPDELWATVEWLPDGADAIRTKRYRYISPTIDWKGRADDGSTHGAWLTGAALTNAPFFQGMAPVSLSRSFSRELLELCEEVETFKSHSAADRRKLASQGNALPDGSYPIADTGDLRNAIKLAQSGHGNVAAAKRLIRKRARELGATLPDGFAASDSPRRMDFMADIAQVFSLDAEASEEQILTAARDAAKAPEPQTFSVEQLTELAEKQGLKVFAADQASELEANAKAGADAAEELRVAKFETAFTAALEDPKGARVAPAQKDLLRKQYDADPESTLALIETFTKLVPGEAKGSGGGPADDAEAPEGVDPEAYAEDRAVQTFMSANPDIDYMTALSKVRAERSAA